MMLIVRGLKTIKMGIISAVPIDNQERQMRRFGDHVRRLRMAKGLSQENLALMCDLDRTYLGGVERGERNISLVNIHKLAAGLAVSVREFFDE